MESSKIQRVVYHLPWYSRFSQHHLKCYLRKIHKINRLKNYPQLACVPSDVIGQSIVLNGLYEEEFLISFETIFRHLLEKFKLQSFIDVGANIGNHALFFSRYFKEIIAFKPNPTALKILDINVFLNQTKNIRIIPLGLSNESGTLPFFEDPENLGGCGFCYKNYHSVSQQKLNLEKGDTIIYRDFKSSSIGVMKLDIEGLELAALQGLKQTLIQHQPIIFFEAHTSQGEMGSQAIFDYLTGLNYSYFYTLERKKLTSSLTGFFIRLVKGYEIILNRLIRPENRFYSLIIATTSPFRIKATKN